MNSACRLLAGAGLLAALSMQVGCDETTTQVLPIPQNAVPSSLVVAVDGSNYWPPAPVLALDASASYDPDGGDIAVSWEVSTVPEGSDLAARLAGDSRPNVVALLTVNGDYRFRARVTGSGNRVKVSPWIDIRVQDALNAYGTAFTQLRGLQMSTGWEDLQVETEPGVPVSLAPPSGVPEDMSYRWVLRYVPEGSVANLTGGDQPSPEFTADTIGSYGVALEILHDGVTQAAALYRVNVVQAGVDPEPELGQAVGAGLVSAQLIPGTRTVVAHGGQKLVVRNLDTGETHELLLPSAVRGVAINPSGTQALVPLNTGMALVAFNSATPSLVWSRSLIDAPYQYYLDALWMDDARAFVVTALATGGSNTRLMLFQATDQSMSLLSGSLISSSYYYSDTVGQYLRHYDGAALYTSDYRDSLRRTGVSPEATLQTTTSLSFAPCISSSNATTFLSSNQIASCGILFGVSAAGVTTPLNIIGYPANFSAASQILSADGTAIYAGYRDGVWKMDLVSGLPAERVEIAGLRSGMQIAEIFSNPQVPLAVAAIDDYGVLRVFFASN